MNRSLRINTRPVFPAITAFAAAFLGLASIAPVASGAPAVYDQSVTFTGKKPGPVSDFDPFLGGSSSGFTPFIVHPGYYGDFSFEPNGKLTYSPGKGFSGWDQAQFGYRDSQGGEGVAVVSLLSSDRKQKTVRDMPTDLSIPAVLRRGLAASVWINRDEALITDSKLIAYLDDVKLGKVTRRPADPRGMLRFPVSNKVPLGAGTVSLRDAETGDELYSFSVNIISKKAPYAVVSADGDDGLLGSWRVPGKSIVNLFGTRSGGRLQSVDYIQVLGKVKANVTLDGAGTITFVEVKGNVVDMRDYSVRLKGSDTFIAPPDPDSSPTAVRKSAPKRSVLNAPPAEKPEVTITIQNETGVPVEGASAVLSTFDARIGSFLGSYPAVEVGPGDYRATLGREFAYTSSKFDACETLGEAADLTVMAAGVIAPGLPGACLSLAAVPPIGPKLALACAATIPVVDILAEIGQADGAPVGEAVQTVCDASLGLVARAVVDGFAYVAVTSAPGLKTPARSKDQRISPLDPLPSFTVTLKIPTTYEGTLSSESYTVPSCSSGTDEITVDGSIKVALKGKKATVTIDWTSTASIGGFPSNEAGTFTIADNRIQGKINKAGRAADFAEINIELQPDRTITGTVNLSTHVAYQEGNEACFDGDTVTNHTVQ